jgi:hypothetical protein
MEGFLNSIRMAATNPLALAAYVVAAILMVYGGFKLKRLRIVMKTARKTGATDLKKLVEVATNTKLPDNITGEQWLKNNRQQGLYAITMAIIIAIVALLAIALFLFLQRSPAQPMPTGTLSLVDIQFLESAQFPKLDLKLRNTGEVALLKQAVFNVQHVWELRDSLRPAALKASWNYDVELPVLGAPYTIAIPISQSIGRGDSDRFTFTLGNDAPPARREYVFLMTVELIYNEDNQKLSGQPLIFIGPPAQYPLAVTASADFIRWKRTFEHNLQLIDEVRKFSAVVSPKALLYLNEYSDATIPKLIEQLGDISAETRLPAAGKLGCFGHRAKQALPKLEKMARIDEHVPPLVET